MSRLRSSEWLLIAYFTYVAIVASWFFAPWKTWVVAGVAAVVIWIFSLTRSVWRDFLPIALTLTAYREMNWFAPAVYDRNLERAWIVWDRWALDEYHLRAMVESAGLLLPVYLESCYMLVYTVAPVSLAILFLNGRRHRVNRFWLIYLAGTLGAYALFPYFPSEPPRTVFAGADLPHLVNVVRAANLWILGGYGIHSSVFPSAHVSSAFSAAWALLAIIPERRWIGWLMVVYALSVSVATVYGRYHYGMDVIAGMAVSLIAVAAVSASGSILHSTQPPHHEKWQHYDRPH